MKIQAGIMHYPWGSSFPESKLQQLMKSDPTKPAAQLWVGTHPANPSAVCSKTLREFLEEKHLKLDCLFKILDVGKPLSIQFHPNRVQAIELHKRKPQIYKDPEGKPEMFLALSQIEFLAGLDPQPQILTFAEVRQLGDNVAQIFLKIVSMDQQQIIKLISSISDKIDRSKRLFQKLSEAFPGDRGIILGLLMRHQKAAEGQAFFVEEGTIHCYLSGLLAQCMNSSDNVIRLGLTNKLIDKQELKLCKLKKQAVPIKARKQQCLMQFVGSQKLNISNLFKPKELKLDSWSIWVFLQSDSQYRAGQIYIFQPGRVISGAFKAVGFRFN